MCSSYRAGLLHASTRLNSGRRQQQNATSFSEIPDSQHVNAALKTRYVCTSSQCTTLLAGLHDRVAALQKLRVVAVAASNKHSAALTSAGELYTWGANSWGQLGYGTSDSASNPTPRLVEALKGKRLTAVDCAKHHTVVLTAEGDPWTWGFQRVTCTR
jgi:alpha-tubulin suppressor-like RCC1 family protein